MTLEAVIYNRATTHAGLSALIVDRCYPDLAPQNVTDPWMTYHNVSAEPIEALFADTELETARFQMGAWSQNKDTAIAVRDQIKAAFKRYRGTHSGVEIVDSHFITTIGSYDPDSQTHHIVIDFDIWYKTV